MALKKGQPSSVISVAQQHFRDLCRLAGHASPAEVDRKGEWFTFEAGGW
jgi:hypothetical protein